MKYKQCVSERARNGNDKIGLIRNEYKPRDESVVSVKKNMTLNNIFGSNKK